MEDKTVEGGEMRWQHNFVRAFKRDFGEPFLPKGFTQAKLLEANRIQIVIGDREVVFEMDGTTEGASTAVGEEKEWEIFKKPLSSIEYHYGDKLGV